MKVEVVSFTGDSGLADYAVSLARALSSQVEAAVVTAKSLPERFDRLGFAVHRPFRRSRHYPFDIVRFIFGAIRRRPDWMLLQGPLKFAAIDALVVRVLRMTGIRVAVTVHDVLPHYPKPWSRFTFGFYYRSFERTIVHSVAAKQGIQELGVKGDALVVPHGVYDIFCLTGIDQSSARRQIGAIERDDFVVLFFGHLESRKGIEPFLSAAAQLAESHPRIKFLLAGANGLGGSPSALSRKLEECRQMRNVVVHDWRIPFEEVEYYFRAANVIALPYLEGTTSGVLKLALAFGKPVIATRVGDFPEQVPEGAGLFLEVDEGLSSALCRAVLEMESNENVFACAMRQASGSAAWPDIASRVIEHLQRN